MVEAGFLVVTIDTRGMAGHFDAVRDSLAFFVFPLYDLHLFASRPRQTPTVGYNATSPPTEPPPTASRPSARLARERVARAVPGAAAGTTGATTWATPAWDDRPDDIVPLQVKGNRPRWGPTTTLVVFYSSSCRVF